MLRRGLSNRTVPPTELRTAVDRALTDPPLWAATEAMAASLLLEDGPTGAARRDPALRHAMTPFAWPLPFAVPQSS